jgi:hypothetical protein
MRDRHSTDAHHCLASIAQSRSNITHDGSGQQVHLAGLPTLKFDGYCKETNDVFEYLGCFWYGCFCMPNRDKPIGK